MCLTHARCDRASGHLCVDLAKRGLLREDILSEMVRLLEARYYFSERVYYHHAKVAAGALVAPCSAAGRAEERWISSLTTSEEYASPMAQ